MTAKEELRVLIDDLSEEDILNVRAYAKRLHESRYEIADMEERRKRIYAIAGAYASVLPSSDDFSERKREEIDREARHF